MKIALACEFADLFGQVKNDSEYFQIPLLDDLKEAPDFLITMGESGYELKDLKNPKLTPLNINPESGALGYRIKKGGQDHLLKAVGKASKVLDLTMGLGKDYFLLKSHGHEVVGVEKNAALSVLLKNTLERLKIPKENFIFGNALEKIDELDGFDVIYMDPMFHGASSSKRKSLPKKDMQIVERLLSNEKPDDYALLLKKARSKARKVVVKRHIKNEPLAKDVSISFKGDTVRFDIYAR